MDKNPREKSTRRLLDPIDRTSEVLFGLIMALSFTCSISAAEADLDDVRTMLIGAIGCNIAWGLIDAVFFLLANLTERAHGLAKLRALRKAKDQEQARGIIIDALPPLIARTMNENDLERIRQQLVQMTEPPARPRLCKDDFLAAAGVFLLVFLATFPVAIPFMFIHHAVTALRVSNAVALVMLFLAGYALGTHARSHPLRMGLLMMLVGSVLVMITIALGG